MRSIKALAVAVSVGALSMGITTISQAIDLHHPGVQQVSPHLPAKGGEKGDGKGHRKGDGKGHRKGGHKGGKKVHVENHDLHYSCVGKSFGYCTKHIEFKQTLIGDVTTGLIGLIGTTSTPPNTTNPSTANGTTNPPGEAQWCSPGFWRNHHPEEWGPTGLDGSESYSSVFNGDLPSRTQAGINAGAPTNPSILFVLQNPQYYGGDDTNRIADELSDRHPDINFTGARVDNCPL
ncbi:hypothetical protein ACIRD9_04135 [Streptomyces violaceus]|jgi:hypothetical protein|uniref:hypothetical protein n=1 Tax=Streptomyces violaceus TaxID=1936 RepID=UPI00381A011B